MTRHWAPGDVVVRREVLHGAPWVGFATYVVQDSDDLLAVFLASGSALVFPQWPFDRWAHPWLAAGHTSWHGHGKLMLHRPGDAYSVDLFWQGPERRFSGWYLNLQDPFRRHATGFDTLDHELDYWRTPDGAWFEKDRELFAQRVAEERYDARQAAAIEATGREVAAMLEAGTPWWDESWAAWEPPEHWGPVAPPAGWDDVPPA
ncbi:MAG: DUF402 domain-containing protein [Nocardioides sp.]